VGGCCLFEVGLSTCHVDDRDDVSMWGQGGVPVTTWRNCGVLCELVLRRQASLGVQRWLSDGNRWWSIGEGDMVSRRHWIWVEWKVNPYSLTLPTQSFLEKIYGGHPPHRANLLASELVIWQPAKPLNFNFWGHPQQPPNWHNETENCRLQNSLIMVCLHYNDRPTSTSANYSAVFFVSQHSNINLQNPHSPAY